MLRIWATPCLLPAGGKAAGSIDLRAQVQTASATAKGTPTPVCRMCVRAPCLWARSAFPPSRFRPARSARSASRAFDGGELSGDVHQPHCQVVGPWDTAGAALTRTQEMSMTSSDTVLARPASSSALEAVV